MWKVGAAKNLEIVNRDTWDAQEAENHIFDWAGWPDNPNPSKARKAFLIYDADNDENKGGYKLPFADVVDGKLVAIDAALQAAAGRLPQVKDAGDDVIKRATAVKDHYFEKIHGKEGKKEDQKSADDKNKSESDAMLDFVITKASYGADGVMRWSATVSKFAVDKEGDEVTKSFYEKAIDKIEQGIHPMPALVVSHFDDSRLEKAYEPVPEVFKAGIATSLYIDGDKPKAKGIFMDTPLGKAAYAGVKSDLDKGLPHEERIRISMAFRPEDGGVEKSEDGHYRYTNGLIRHFALTRVPIVKETEIMVQKSETVARKTRYDDAKTIIGDELAKELDTSYKSIMKSKSEDGLLLEKADDSKDGKSAADQHMKNGKFDMGDCLSVKMGEGKERKQALAMCLSMSKGKPRAKAELDDLFDNQACMEEYTGKGLSDAAASAICMHQQQMLSDMMEEAGETPSEEAAEQAGSAGISKAYMERPTMDCVESFVKDGKSEEEAKLLCNSDEAVKARIYKAALDGDLDAIVKAVISDGEITVVEKSKKAAAKDESNTETVNSEDAGTDTSKDESADEPSVNQKKSKKKDQTDAGEANQEKSEADPMVDNLVMLFKSTLLDTSLGRGQKVTVVNKVLEQLGELAKNEITQHTPATAEDQAAVMKAALQEAIAPFVTELNTLRSQNEALEMLLTKGGVVKAHPKQLVNMNTSPVEKADLEPAGAMTAAQIAEASIRQVRY